MFEQLFDVYQQRLRAGALLDFDDLLLESLRLLDTGDDVAALYKLLGLKARLAPRRASGKQADARRSRSVLIPYPNLSSGTK